MSYVRNFMIVILIPLLSGFAGLLREDKFNILNESYEFKIKDGLSYKLKLPNLGIKNEATDSSKLLKDGDVRQIIDLINENYYYSSGELNKVDLKDKILKSIVSSLGDEHSIYLTSKEKNSLNDTLKGEFEGIGISVEAFSSGGLLVKKIFKSSPAEISNLKIGDIIMKANKFDCSNSSVEDCISNIKGIKGTFVELQLIRDGKTISKSVKRDKINVPSVETELLGDNYGYINIGVFGENTSDELKVGLESFKLKSIKGLILDLRNNGGGYLQTAIGVLNNFTEEGKIVTILKENDKEGKEKSTEYYSKGNNEYYQTLPIVVLINQNSASASEITAGALKLRDNVIVLGEKSYGKGSAQELFDTEDGGDVKLTVAKWFTPDGNSIDKKGISPNIEVELDFVDVLRDGKDTQLEKAKEVLKELEKTKNKQVIVSRFNKEKR